MSKKKHLIKTDLIMSGFSQSTLCAVDRLHLLNDRQPLNFIKKPIN